MTEEQILNAIAAGINLYFQEAVVNEDIESKNYLTLENKWYLEIFWIRY